jgi:sec-independent protein translocase protein TatA
MINEILNTLAFGMPGGPEWIIILIIAVLIFGRRLPDIARSVGKSITEFKKGVHEAKDDVKSSIDEASDVAMDSSEDKKDDDTV